MNWADKIPGLDPADARRAADIQARKEALNREAAELKDSIVKRINALVDEEVALYRDIVRKKQWKTALYPAAIEVMDYSTLVRLLEGRPVTAEALTERHTKSKVS
ncbi:hypothetical protein WYO_0150 [Methylobacterium sp. GXF4]|uniref:hypothetical protein n=1 Tax=Methylobacterium sp. GXF4 TaxID=1096546 RepID=UPI0002698C3F|nr:hypothetical protein [Methylobacterium sp. GXF4]EIZ87113.1 hypothetical protein WYO_0150 [Methylobacterium sp. GXF4]